MAENIKVSPSSVVKPTPRLVKRWFYFIYFLSLVAMGWVDKTTQIKPEKKAEVILSIVTGTTIIGGAAKIFFGVVPKDITTIGTK